ncbi:Copper-exporting P-type ATPase A [Yarrowia sp. C11]|nr:Copper-exporting P-type ATPase A [Yarrowia sp. C11]
MSLGVNVSYWTSLALLILAAKSPIKEEHDGEKEMGYHTTFFDSVVFLTMFLLIGRCLEAYSKARAASAISLLSDLRPKEAILVFPEQILDDKLETDEKDETDSENEDHTNYSGDEKVPIDYLEIGDFIRVLPGMTPPTDCIVVQGGSTFDESALTGESRPVRHGQGDQIFAGTVNNGSGSLVAKVMALEGGSLLDQIVNVVREGQLHRAPIERVADKLTSVFVPIVTCLAIVTWIIWLALGTSGALPDRYLDVDLGGWVVWSLQFAISVFVVACPCGIGLAAPTALFVGTGLAAKHGILARGGGEAFQEGARVDVVCFDKTGTLTEGGEPKITDEKVIMYDSDDVFFLAKLIEQQSSHPLAVAVVNHVSSKALVLSGYSVNVEEVPGKGLKGTLAVPKTSSLGQAGVTEFLFGNERLIEEHKAVISNQDAALLHKWKTEGKSVMLMALRPDGGDFSLALIVSAEDKIRAETPAVIKALQDQNIQTWMISGDNQITANAVAARIGIPADNVIGGVLPQEKAAKVQWLQKTAVSARSGKSTGRAIVAMVGDGVNDAPSLSTADVGIAIGSGADIAMSSAKFVLMRSDLTSVLTLLDLSKATFRRIKLNFAWALVYNCIGIPVAAGVIYPYNNSRLDPVWASLAMALSSVSVICSSLLLRLYRPPKVQFDAEVGDEGESIRSVHTSQKWKRRLEKMSLKKTKSVDN